MLRKLEGKVAIVTGGNSGIGEATVHLFAQEGASVAIMARREEQGRMVQDAVQAKGSIAEFIRCDVSKTDDIRDAVDKTVALFGGVDVLFNNAGLGLPEQFPNESREQWDYVLDVNLNGVFDMCSAVWPHMVRGGGGAIVNMSSVAATSGFSPYIYHLSGRLSSASYHVAKAGVDALTR